VKIYDIVFYSLSSKSKIITFVSNVCWLMCLRDSISFFKCYGNIDNHFNRLLYVYATRLRCLRDALSLIVLQHTIIDVNMIKMRIKLTPDANFMLITCSTRKDMFEIFLYLTDVLKICGWRNEGN
jgi:hypothetical protein